LVGIHGGQVVVVRGKGSSGDGQKRKVAIVRAAISFPVLVCFKEVGNRLMAGLLRVRFRRIGREVVWCRGNRNGFTAAECPLWWKRCIFRQTLVQLCFSMLSCEICAAISSIETTVKADAAPVFCLFRGGDDELLAPSPSKACF
jgi:hypothetical protein